ncbi:prepilin-type N-terminal cleavage/methylation domain-containing protein [Natronincola peptidivorans]|uniref:Prepilin-type N-terminal cleavage/methylation domain-containing protein n=1 Tax=Natronincola peptidivorans TaxID=426128 RepID=A0A1H9YQD2_9FIRM|nr:prepilin-type N-terminal cleavage/methylation domain-containing protein [Natronincola peptidivorans]SES71264.1 prepilin-type N-terminal cleavage/methylation domain-containing protein [Natronincola peptidivorans]
MKNNSGFTLIEVLIALVISTLIIGVTSSIMMEIFHTNKRSKIHYDLSKTTQGIMEEIKASLSQVEDQVNREEQLLNTLETLQSTRDNCYDTTISLKRLYDEKNIYEIIVRLENIDSNEVYFLHNYFYDTKGDELYQKIYQEFFITTLDDNNE